MIPEVFPNIDCDATELLYHSKSDAFLQLVEELTETNEGASSAMCYIATYSCIATCVIPLRCMHLSIACVRIAMLN